MPQNRYVPSAVPPGAGKVAEPTVSHRGLNAVLRVLVRPLFRSGKEFRSDVFGVRRHRHRAAEEQRSRPRTLLRAVGEPLFQVRRAKCTREPLSHSYIFCSVFRSFPPCRLTASTSHSFSVLLGRSHCLGTCLDTLRAARTSVASLPPYQRMQIRQKNAVFMTVAASALRSPPLR